MEAFDAVLTLTALIVFGLIGWEIGRRRDQAFIGFVAGFLVGPIGWLAVYLSYPEIKAEPAPKHFIPRGTFRGPSLKKYSSQLAKDPAWEKAVRGE